MKKKEIVIGQTYQDRYGTQVIIGGHCESHSEWFWSITGNWYDKYGQFLILKKNSNNEYRTRKDSWHNLKIGVA